MHSTFSRLMHRLLLFLLAAALLLWLTSHYPTFLLL